jgi:hypothetical protein
MNDRHILCRKSQADPQMSAVSFTSSSRPSVGGGFAAASAGGRAFGIVPQRVLACCTPGGESVHRRSCIRRPPRLRRRTRRGSVDRCGRASEGIQAGRRAPGHFHCERIGWRYGAAVKGPLRRPAAAPDRCFLPARRPCPLIADHPCNPAPSRHFRACVQQIGRHDNKEVDVVVT